MLLFGRELRRVFGLIGMIVGRFELLRVNLGSAGVAKLPKTMFWPAQNTHAQSSLYNVKRPKVDPKHESCSNISTSSTNTTNKRCG